MAVGVAEKERDHMPYCQLHYHLIWSTHRRDPTLVGEMANLVERSIRASCLELETVLHALSVMPDHVHVALSIPPKHSVSSVVKRLKGSSSHLVNHAGPRRDEERFSWQSEYGALTFGRKVLKDVVAYIVDQPARHADLRLWAGMERTGDPP